MRGNRIRTGQYAARHLAARSSRRRHCDAEWWPVAKVVVCGAIFVLIVAFKLLFPETAASFGKAALQLIGSDADFTEAIAAMGRAAGGDERVGNSLQDAYAAVFGPSSEQNEEHDRLMDAALDDPTSYSELVAAYDPGIEEDRVTTAGVSYSGLIPELPENVDQLPRELGFECVIPVCGTVSSSFGWRIHPLAGDLRFHYGVDFAADIGTDICAFADGEVFATGESSTLGKYIILSHENGFRTLYAHCDSVLKLKGVVYAGEVIAAVGQSGYATGPHLHFELMNGQMYLDPACYVEVG